MKAQKKEKRKAKKKTYERGVTLGNPFHFVAAVFADYSYAHHIVCIVIAVPGRTLTYSCLILIILKQSTFTIVYLIANPSNI